MSESIQRLTSVAVAFAITIPLSLFAESRHPERTDLENITVEIEHVLGKKRVEVRALPRVVTPGEESIRGNDEQRAFLAAMNEERGLRGLPPLRLNAHLCAAASDRVRDMFARSYFDHIAPDGMQPWTWADREGYRYRAIAENLAVGFRGARAVVDGWMHSPGHRANLLHGDYCDVGLAVAEESPTSRFSGPLVVAIYANP